MLDVEVVFIAADGTLFQKHLQCYPSQNVLQALEQSGLFNCYPQCRKMLWGIFSRTVSAEQVLMDGDRIEVYRSLSIDPMKKRRIRAKKC